MIRHNFSLSYSLQTGELEPYVSGLQNGKAVASQCTECNLTSFPPQRTCRCGANDKTWRTLSGKAEIIHQTRGSDGDFALVRFEGSDTSTVVSLIGIDDTRTNGEIVRPDGALPQIRLGPLPKKAAT